MHLTNKRRRWEMKITSHIPGVSLFGCIKSITTCCLSLWVCVIWKTMTEHERPTPPPRHHPLRGFPSPAFPCFTQGEAVVLAGRRVHLAHLGRSHTQVVGILNREVLSTWQLRSALNLTAQRLTAHLKQTPNLHISQTVMMGKKLKEWFSLGFG